MADVPSPSDPTGDPVVPRPIPRGSFSPSPSSLAERLADRLHDWRSDSRVGVAILIAVAVVAGFVWYRVGTGGNAGADAAARAGPTDAIERSLAPADPDPPTTTQGAGPARIAVHVAGAVTSPGVVELREGARVIDAIEAVGGAHTEGDLDRLNLAAKLVDGQRVFVPRVGQADPGVQAGGGDPGAPGAGDAALTPGGKLDLNTATQAQLEALPGIGPAYAQAIIGERERRGGFTSINELRSVRGIGEKRFAELAPLVTV